jgi:hypothetical protein
MKWMLPSQRFLVLFLLVLVAIGSVAEAQQSRLHPAYKVAEKYLRASHLHQWTYAVKMIEKKSLENLKRIQKRFLLSAPTIPEEEELLRRLGLTDVSGLDALTPEQVFVRRASGNTRDLVDPEAHIAQVEKTLSLKTLSTATEGTEFVHSLLRVQYEVKNRRISELALVSMVKEGTVWKISLDAQEPSVEKVDPLKR